MTSFSARWDLSDTPRLKGSMSVGTRFLEPMSSSMRTPIRIYHNSASTARGIGPRLVRDANYTAGQNTNQR